MSGTRINSGGFTLIELLVVVSVLGILMVMIAQIVNSATTLTGLSNKHQDADSRARLLFGRMAVDFGAMLRRSDVDYYLKNDLRTQVGNDQMAFYSEVLGYFGAGNDPGPVSLVAYRVGVESGGISRMERLGRGLSWSGESSGEAPVVYLPVLIENTWPEATGATADPDYEDMAPGVFRFEYFYLLKTGELSSVPWDEAGGSSSVSGWKDVAGIIVTIAVANREAGLMVSNDDLKSLAAQMVDFSDGMEIGDLRKQWSETILGSSLPRPVAISLRTYSRVFLVDSGAL